MATSSAEAGQLIFTEVANKSLISQKKVIKKDAADGLLSIYVH